VCVRVCVCVCVCVHLERIGRIQITILTRFSSTLSSHTLCVEVIGKHDLKTNAISISRSISVADSEVSSMAGSVAGSIATSLATSVASRCVKSTG